LSCLALPSQRHLDVIVLDLTLPGIDGLTFAHEPRSWSDIGLIVVTRQVASEARIAAWISAPTTPS
jgi:DNA-binding response OmpR family regulator